MKHSGDDPQKYGGFFYVSEPYFLAKTVNVMVHRDAIPGGIVKKLGLK